MKSPVVRNIVAAVLGYVAMFAAAFVLFSLLWMILGADGAFAPGSWDVTGTWLAGTMVLGVIVAIAGGFTCSKLAASRQGIHILIVLVIIMAILSALPDAPDVITGVRPDDISMFDAMSQATQPRWTLWLNPVIGVLGVLYGAKLQGGASA